MNDNNMIEGIHKDLSKYSDDIYTFSYLVRLKLLISFDLKDKNNLKMDYINAYKYPSNKYKNKTKLIKIVRKFKSYLIIEYPGNSNETVVKKNYYFCMEDMLGIIDICKQLDRVLLEPFAYKKDKLIFISENAKVFDYINIFGQKIEITQSLHETGIDKNILVPGVRMTLNEDYSFTMPIEKWKGFIYNIIKCDLYGWGASLANSVNVNINDILIEIGESNNSSHNNFNSDDEEETPSPKINKSKPFNNKNRLESFFDKEQ